MFIVTVFLTMLLASICVASAASKFTKQAVVVSNLTKIGVPSSWFPFLAGAEMAGAVGLLFGLVAIPPLGIAAGIGLILYFAGAVVSHLRVGDKDIAGAAVLFLLAVATTLVRSYTF